MKSEVNVKAGVCGFESTIVANCEDGQHVTFAIETNCGHVEKLAAMLAEKGPIDGFNEINPRSDNLVLLPLTASPYGSSCLGCVVPVALYKAMQVAVGLALPSDIELKISKLE